MKENQEPRNKPLRIWSTMHKEAKSGLMNKVAAAINDVWKLDNHMQKNETDL